MFTNTIRYAGWALAALVAAGLLGGGALVMAIAVFSGGTGEVYAAVDFDADGFKADVDCDDFNNTVYPGAPEILDGIDNDCDGMIDEGTSTPIPPTPTITPTPTKLAKPGDTDGDGCPDEHENGLDETQGGLRDWQDPNDYYDVLGPGGSLTLDGVIDLPNDILGVIQHFAPLGTEPEYDVRFDRGVTIGANHWQRAGPDGVIDLPNDILGVIQQFSHNCI